MSSIILRIKHPKDVAIIKSITERISMRSLTVSSMQDDETSDTIEKEKCGLSPHEKMLEEVNGWATYSIKNELTEEFNDKIVKSEIPKEYVCSIFDEKMFELLIAAVPFEVPISWKGALQSNASVWSFTLVQLLHFIILNCIPQECCYIDLIAAKVVEMTMIYVLLLILLKRNRNHTFHNL